MQLKQNNINNYKNMKFKSLIAILLLVITFTSCDLIGGGSTNEKNTATNKTSKSSIPKDSLTVAVKKWPNGNIREKAEAININYGVKGLDAKWIRHGELTEYQENKKGVLLSRTMYNMGKKEGKAYKYYEDGKVYIEWFYTNGKKDGLVKKFSDEGAPISVVPYKQDRLGVGTIEYSNTTGKPLTMPKLQVWTKDDRRANGTFTVYAKVVSKHGTNLKASFYEGLLIEDKYYHKNLEANKFTMGSDRIASKKYYVSNGIPQQISVVAKFTTIKRTPVLLNKKISVN